MATPTISGLSGWLVERFDIPFVSTLTEWLMPQVRVLEGQGGLRPEVERHLKSLACADDMIDRLKRDRHWAGALIYPMPASLERIRNGEEVVFGRRSWRVITAGGHAPEHASFYCAADNILIAGDQILPRISPMIGVWSEQPHANPLAEYLTSLDRFRSLPEDTLVLPSHGLPFLGLHRRIDQLQEHHRQRLTQLEEMMDVPRNGMELAAGLFKKAVHEGHARLALAETLAHINYLIADNRASRERGQGRAVDVLADERQGVCRRPGKPRRWRLPRNPPPSPAPPNPRRARSRRRRDESD